MNIRNIVLISVAIGNLLTASSLSAEDSMKNAFTHSSNKFAFDLYNEFAAKEGNVFFSPLSVSGAMALVYAGASGETSTALAGMLRVESSESLLSDFRRTRERLISEAGKPTVDSKTGGVNSNTEARTPLLRLATGLWFGEWIQIDKSYQQQVEATFKATVGRINAEDPEASLKEINAWVAKQTNDKIKDLFGAGSIQSSTPLALANAVYFKGQWARPFEKTESIPGPFAREEGEPINVDFMNQTDKFTYAENDVAKLIELPFAGEKLMFVAVLPKPSTLTKSETFRDFEQKFGLEEFQKLYSDAGSRLGNLSLPRFTFEHSPDLQSALIKLGAANAFSPAADFSKMTADKSPLYIAEAVHKAVIEVNEEGSEAAAATGMVMATGMPVAEIPFEFRADRPFLFFILDRQSELILFIGRVSNPREN